MAVSKRLRYEVLRRDSHTCRYCGRSAPDVKLQVDHVVPESLSGKTEASNLVTACADCNSGKSSTSPDAPLVAVVEEHAIAWSAAMKQAARALLNDIEARDSRRAEFETAWNAWGRGSGPDRVAMPKDESWRQSVDQLTAAGLPMRVLLDCIPIAMEKAKIPDDRRFRYMCGVAWNRVTELQESAKKIVGSDVQSASSQTGPSDEGRIRLANEILNEQFDEETRQRYISDALRWAAEDEEESPWSAADIQANACYEAVANLSWDHGRLRSAFQDLLSLFHPSDLELANELARLETSEHRSRAAEEPSEAEAWSAQVYWLTRLRFFDALPSEEQMEWAACVAADSEGVVTDNHFLRIIRHAWDCHHQGFRALGTNCTYHGDHGALCPTKAAFRVRIEGCQGCADIDREECCGHHVCQPHAEGLVDGRVFSEATGETIIVRDYVELTAVN